MPLILAIEPDQEQAARLGDLIRARVQAELVHVPTTERALAAIGDRVPDLVLVPSLLSPQEDAALAGALRVIATAAHVRMLTIPVLAPSLQHASKRSVLQKWRRRGVEAPAGGCDPSVFAEQIKTYLDEAEAERAAEAEFEIADQLFESSIPTKMTELDEPLAASSAVVEAVVEVERQKAAESAADAVIVTEVVDAADATLEPEATVEQGVAAETQAETEAQAPTVAVAPDAETALEANAASETDSGIDEQFVLGVPLETTAAIEADSVIEWEAVIEAEIALEAADPIEAADAIEAEAAIDAEAIVEPEAVIEWEAVVEVADAEFAAAAAAEIDADLAAEVAAAILLEDEAGLEIAWEELSPSDDLEFVALEQTLGLVPPPPPAEPIAASPEPDANPEIRADLIARVDAVVSRVIKNLRAARAAQAARPVTNEPEPALINQPVVDERRVMTESTAVVVTLPESEASTSDTSAILTHLTASEPIAAAPAIESAAIESAAIESATEPAPVEVAASEPAPVEVVATEPAPIEVAATKPAPIEVAATKPAPVEVAAAEPAAIPAPSPAAVPPAREKKAVRVRQQPNHGWVALVDALRRDLERQRQQEQKKNQQQSPAPAQRVALPVVAVSAAEAPAAALAAEPEAPALATEHPAPALAAEPEAPAVAAEPPAPALTAEPEAAALATEPSRRRPRKRRPSPPKSKVTVPARPASPRPAQDEWGMFDPNQCGFAALLAKLDEITETENEAST